MKKLAIFALLAALVWPAWAAAEDAILLDVQVAVSGNAQPMFNPKVAVAPGDEASVVIGAPDTGMEMNVVADRQGEKISVRGAIVASDGTSTRTVQDVNLLLADGESRMISLGAPGEPGFEINVRASNTTL